jgi:hypothetical protein
MVSVEIVTEWLAQHGYRDQYPRRDASRPDALFYVFVKDGHRRLGVQCVKGKVRRLHFEKLKQVVMQDEQEDPKNT